LCVRGEGSHRHARGPEGGHLLQPEVLVAHDVGVVELDQELGLRGAHPPSVRVSDLEKIIIETRQIGGAPQCKRKGLRFFMRYLLGSCQLRKLRSDTDP